MSIKGLRGWGVSDGDGNLGDPFGVVPHSLQLHDDVQQRDNDPKVAGHRLLGGNEVDAPVLDLEPPAVDVIVVVDYFLGRNQVPAFQGVDGAVDRLADEGGQGLHILFQKMELLVEIFSGHIRSLGPPGNGLGPPPERLPPPLGLQQGLVHQRRLGSLAGRPGTVVSDGVKDLGTDVVPIICLLYQLIKECRTG